MNISMLMMANLLGFVTGLDGLWDYLRVLMGEGRVFLIGVMITFFASAQVRIIADHWLISFATLPLNDGRY